MKDFRKRMKPWVSVNVGEIFDSIKDFWKFLKLYIWWVLILRPRQREGQSELILERYVQHRAPSGGPRLAIPSPLPTFTALVAYRATQTLRAEKVPLFPRVTKAETFGFWLPMAEVPELGGRNEQPVHINYAYSPVNFVNKIQPNQSKPTKQNESSASNTQNMTRGLWSDFFISVSCSQKQLKILFFTLSGISFSDIKLPVQNQLSTRSRLTVSTYLSIIDLILYMIWIFLMEIHLYKHNCTII